MAPKCTKVVCLTELPEPILARIFSSIICFRTKLDLRLVCYRFFEALETPAAWSDLNRLIVRWDGDGRYR